MPLHPPQSSHTIRQQPHPHSHPRNEEEELKALLNSAMVELHKKDQAIASYAMSQDNSPNSEKCKGYFKTLEILIFVLLAVTVIMSIVLIVICQKLNTVMNLLNALK
jgi:hypothetical protein